MDSETINIEIILESFFRTLPPQVEIFIDDKKIYSESLPNGTEKIQTIQKLKLDQQHCVKIVRQGKDISCQEQLVKLVGIKIDDINVRDIVNHNCLYYPDYPEPWATEQNQKGITLEYPVLGETWFGHNGTWIFEFKSPFYGYLIDQVRGT